MLIKLTPESETRDRGLDLSPVLQPRDFGLFWHVSASKEMTTLGVIGSSRLIEFL